MKKKFWFCSIVYFWPCQRKSCCLNKSTKQVSCNAKLNKLQGPVGHSSDRLTQNWALVPSWIYHLNSCRPQCALVVDGYFWHGDWMHVLCGPEGLSSSCRSRCWFIFSPDYLCASSAARESKYSAHQLPRAANCTAGSQGNSPRGAFTLSFRFSVLHCQLLSVHS